MSGTVEGVVLLPCPFCGAEARRFKIDKDEPNNAGGDVIVCTACQASSHVEFGRKENLVSRWNTRALSQTPRAPGEVERYELQRLKIARALGERFIARGNARVTGSGYKSYDEMPYSYTADFLADAEAVLEMFTPPPAVVSETVTDLFNEALNEWGAAGYGRDTLFMTNFTAVVGKLQRDVLAALSAPTLATVAAANDEGVVLDWRAVAKLAGEHGVRYRTNTALEKFLTAIRLLSQGKGKS